MKKALLATGALAALLAGCGSSGYTSSGGSAPKSSGTTATTTTSAASSARSGYGGGGYGAASSSASTASGGAGSRLKLEADESGGLYFDHRTLSGKSGTVTLVMENPSSSGKPHGIAVEGNGVDKDGRIVQPGGTSVLTLKLKPGRYTFYCPVPGHEHAGMKGTLVIS